MEKLQTIEAALQNIAELKKSANQCESILAGIRNDTKRIARDVNALIQNASDSPVQITEEVTSAKANGKTEDKLGRCENAILTALAQRGLPSSKSQIGALSGYSKNSSGSQNALSKLRQLGFIKGNGDSICITESGVAALGHFQPLPTGRELHQYWYNKLPRAEATILKTLIDSHPVKISKTEIGRRIGYSITSSGFQNAMSQLRKLDLITGYEPIHASDSLF